MPESESFLPVTPSHAVYLNDLCTVINDWADKKGWNEDESQMSPREVTMHKAEQIALMHSELSECLEFLRKKPTYVCPDCNGSSRDPLCVACPQCEIDLVETPVMDDHVPSLTGEAAELADVLIRIFHYCGKRKIDLGQAVMLKHQYNITRPYRHGKNC